ncbi:MAG: hypothetical protein KAV82_07320 [Phycisphaerae bacterium]|nr:hypothetical protein [Phycisphaerae bacterium]
MSVTYFRTRRAGPEAAIEDAVAAKVSQLFDTIEGRCWTAGSLSIGAGMPDLAIVTFDPHVVAISKLNVPDVELLAYLRAVREAKPETIAQRTGRPMKTVVRILEDMCDAQIVGVSGEVFALHESWRNVLPEIVTVEAKVNNWQVALAQAIRNSIFAHRSYVALPSRVARRIRGEIGLRHYGIGVLDEIEPIRVGVECVPRHDW